MQRNDWFYRLLAGYHAWIFEQIQAVEVVPRIFDRVMASRPKRIGWLTHPSELLE